MTKNGIIKGMQKMHQFAVLEAKTTSL